MYCIADQEDVRIPNSNFLLRCLRWLNILLVVKPSLNDVDNIKTKVDCNGVLRRHFYAADSMKKNWKQPEI